MIGAVDASQSGLGDVWKPVLILLGVLLLAYLAMWRGWRRRSGKHDLPPLVPAPDATPDARLASAGSYFGTTVHGDWLDRVVAHGLGTRSRCRLLLSDAGVDVLRGSRSFRIPAEALRGARHDQGIAGKVVPPHGVLVLTWRHGDLTLDSGFRVTDLSEPHQALAGSRSDKSVTGVHNEWVRTVSEIAKENTA
jgi:hypothetical protein